MLGDIEALVCIPYAPLKLTNHMELVLLAVLIALRVYGTLVWGANHIHGHLFVFYLGDYNCLFITDTIINPLFAVSCDQPGGEINVEKYWKVPYF